MKNLSNFWEKLFFDASSILCTYEELPLSSILLSDQPIGRRIEADNKVPFLDGACVLQEKTALIAEQIKNACIEAFDLDTNNSVFIFVAECMQLTADMYNPVHLPRKLASIMSLLQQNTEQTFTVEKMDMDKVVPLSIRFIRDNDNKVCVMQRQQAYSINRERILICTSCFRKVLFEGDWKVEIAFSVEATT